MKTPAVDQLPDPDLGPLEWTPLVDAPLLAQQLGLGALKLKLESAHPSGVHKHREALRAAELIRAEGGTRLVAGTCGNLGLALAWVGRTTGISVELWVPRDHQEHDSILVSGPGLTVHRVEGTYEDAVAEAARSAKAHGGTDAGPYGPWVRQAMGSYAQIAFEVVKQMETRPSAVWVGVGNGTTLAGIEAGFRFGEARSPMFGAVGLRGRTAAVVSLLRRREVELSPTVVAGPSRAAALLNWRSAHSGILLSIAGRVPVVPVEVDEDELVEAAADLTRETGRPVTPAGAAGLAGLRRWLQETGARTGRHVVIVTA